MRTTIDLPAEVMQAAKIRAAELGVTLKELFSRAITHELGLPAARQGASRVTLPLVGVAATPAVHVTNADIEAALAADEAERYGG
ncbi:hypothetical protein JQS43_25235 [Natronosporangium hydrolyticum]|uniref:Antitoxin n=1 Tax=Natronosporangium hydrolyticum TaxID=2811111 RepID=A0A895YGS7_9ACTN|nr:hypothetical protein [Natronosporangium hydrolyticum]QSB14719.1 hypothetical protein JQS43_25235 [Natronosporangium hydrolyticum]